MTPPWRYRLLVRLLSPLLLGYTAWRALKDGGWRYWWERLGVYRRSDSRPDQAESSDSLWVHAASVGEVITVLPLIEAWQSASPRADILLTTGTPTGAAIVQEQAIEGLRHQYLPVDFAGATDRFVAQLQARRGWIVETEIWPWLYARCEQRGIALTIVNGRLSERTSTQADGLMGSSYRQALSAVHVLARSQADVDNFLVLGAPATQVQLAGNLKHAHTASGQTHPRPVDRAYVLAASTHNDEELQLARAWAGIDTSLLLVIVPRHPERGSSLSKELTQLGISVSRRAVGEQPAETDRLYLADTLGEMQVWYQHATACFVGGSLIPRGGHNMLEPARHACPTVVGPHTDNFADIMRMMTEANAIEVVQSAEEVVQFLARPLEPDSDEIAMGQRALALAESSGAVLHRYLQLLD